MYKLKSSLIALAVLVIFVVHLTVLTPLVGLVQGGSPNAPPRRDLRKFYLTQTTHNGSQTLSACAEGYHMASLWEIFDPSNLRYNTELGFTTGDSGFGPPSAGIGPPGEDLPTGWIRTGSRAASSTAPGAGNCQGWTSASSTTSGTRVFLSNIWSSTDVTRISPWVAGVSECDAPRHVWCVQD